MLTTKSLREAGKEPAESSQAEAKQMANRQSKAQYNVPNPMRDGTTLRSDVYLPNGKGPFPTLVTRTPYNKLQSNMVPTYERLAESGYAVVAQDIRGRWASDGEFHPMFNRDCKDGEDGYDTIEWAADQPWSNSKVGTFGYSYASWTQWSLARTKPPHLVTMFTGGFAPRSTDWMLGGVFRPGRQLQWTLGSMAPDTQRFLDRPHGPTTVEEYEYLESSVNREKWLWYLPYKDLPLEAIGGLRGRFHDWLASINEDMFNIEESYEKIDLPVHHRTGWYDRLSRTVDLFRGMREKGATEKARNSQRLIVGPWTHTNTLTRKTGDVDFGPEAEVDYFSLIVPWFDYWLRGVQNGVMDRPPVRLFVMGSNRWRDEEAWPLVRAQPTDFYLRSRGQANTPQGDGVLSLEPQPDGIADGYTYDPRDPVMSLFSYSGHDEPHDHRVLDRRQDVLVYQTNPLERPIEVTGVPVLKVYATSTAPDTDFIARLVDVHPDGFAQNLCYGIVRARFREGLDQPNLMNPGEVYRFVVELLPTSILFKAGHRIRLDISSSDFPNFDRNHNTGQEDWAHLELRPAKQTIFHDASRPSCLTLPIVP